MQLATALQLAQQGRRGRQQLAQGGGGIQLLGMQVGAAVATGDGVNRQQAVLAGFGEAHQQVGLLTIRPIEPGVAEHGIGPQAAGATVAALAPVERDGALLHQGDPGKIEGFIGAVPAGQPVGHRRLPALRIHPLLHAQLVADATDRPLGVEALLVGRLLEINDLGVGEARQRREVMAFGQVGSLQRRRQGKAQVQGKKTHGRPQRISIDWADFTTFSAEA